MMSALSEKKNLKYHRLSQPAGDMNLLAPISIIYLWKRHKCGAKGLQNDLLGPIVQP